MYRLIGDKNKRPNTALLQKESALHSERAAQFRLENVLHPTSVYSHELAPTGCVDDGRVRFPARWSRGGAVTTHSETPDHSTTRRRSARLSGKAQCIEDGALEPNRLILEMYCGSEWRPVSHGSLVSKKADEPLEEEEDASDDGEETAEEGTSGNQVHIPRCLRYESGFKSWLHIDTVGESFRRLVATSGSFKTLHPRTFYELDVDEELPGMVRAIEDCLVGDVGLVLLPILHRCHWTLATVTQQSVVHYDPARQAIPLQLRKLFLALNRTVVRLKGDAPRQHDDDSCGVYVCLMARNIVEGKSWSKGDAVKDVTAWRSSFAAQLRLEQQAASATNAVSRPVSPGLTGLPPTTLDSPPVLPPTASCPPMCPPKRKSDSPIPDASPPAKAIALGVVPICERGQTEEQTQDSKEPENPETAVENDEDRPEHQVQGNLLVLPNITSPLNICIVNGMGSRTVTSVSKCSEALLQTGLNPIPTLLIIQNLGLRTKKKEGFLHFIAFGLLDQGEKMLQHLSTPTGFKEMFSANCKLGKEITNHRYAMTYKHPDEVVLASYYFDLWITLRDNKYCFSPFGLLTEKNGVLQVENPLSLAKDHSQAMIQCYKRYTSLGKIVIEKAMSSYGISYAYWKGTPLPLQPTLQQ